MEISQTCCTVDWTRSEILTPASLSAGPPSEARIENKTEDVRESVALSAARLHLSLMRRPRTHVLHLPRHPQLD